MRGARDAHHLQRQLVGADSFARRRLSLAAITYPQGAVINYLVRQRRILLASGDGGEIECVGVLVLWLLFTRRTRRVLLNYLWLTRTKTVHELDAPLDHTLLSSRNKTPVKTMTK